MQEEPVSFCHYPSVKARQTIKDLVHTTTGLSDAQTREMSAGLVGNLFIHHRCLSCTHMNACTTDRNKVVTRTLVFRA